MFTLRATAKLLKRLHEEADPAPPAPTTRLGDWYANELRIGHLQLVLAASERTLLPVLMPLAPSATLAERLPVALGEVPRALGIPEPAIAAELTEMNMSRLSRTANRRVLGSMNDFANMLSFNFDPAQGLLTDAIFLARSPCSPLGMESPDRLTRELFGIATTGAVPRCS